MTDLHFPPKKERHRKFGSIPPIPGDKPTSKDQMLDLQNRREDYWFDLDQVGVSSVKHPILFRSPLAPAQQTPIASLELTTTLSRDAKGINMSRLTEQLERYRHTDFVSDPASLNAFTRELAEAMQQDGATLKLEFPWFYERSAPVSGQVGLAHAELSIEARYHKHSQPEFSLTVGIRASVTTLCPCSKGMPLHPLIQPRMPQRRIHPPTRRHSKGPIPKEKRNIKIKSSLKPFRFETAFSCMFYLFFS